MLQIAAALVSFVVAATALAGEFSARDALLAEAPMDWAPYERDDIHDKVGTARQLGLCVIDDLYTAEHFHFIDIDGDDTTDVLYEGPAIDCERASEGWETKLFLVRNGAAHLVFQRFGSIRAIRRDNASRLISFILRDAGCCASMRVFYGLFVPESEPGGVEFTLTRKLMRVHRLEIPESYDQEDNRLLLTQPSTDLRGTTEVLNNQRVYPLDDTVGTGNVVARLQAGTSVEVVSTVDRPDGRWFLVVAPASAATWLLQSPRWINDSEANTEIVGWMRGDID